MTDKTYQFVCDTCDESGFIDGFEGAQECFNEHAERGCEVVIHTVPARGRLRRPETARSDATTNNSQPVDD